MFQTTNQFWTFRGGRTWKEIETEEVGFTILIRTVEFHQNRI